VRLRTHKHGLVVILLTTWVGACTTEDGDDPYLPSGTTSCSIGTSEDVRVYAIEAADEPALVEYCESASEGDPSDSSPAILGSEDCEWLCRRQQGQHVGCAIESVDEACEWVVIECTAEIAYDYCS
jgi:hypothetical protein